MSGYRTGRMCRVYIDVAGAGVGTYVQLMIAKNPTLGITSDEAVVEDAASRFKRYLKGLLDAPLSIEINRKVGDTLYKALRDAALTDDVIGVAVASGDMTTVGEEVFEADFIVTDFPWDMPISDTATGTVQLKLAANTDFQPTLSDVAA